LQEITSKAICLPFYITADAVIKIIISEMILSINLDDEDTDWIWLWSRWTCGLCNA